MPRSQLSEQAGTLYSKRAYAEVAELLGSLEPVELRADQQLSFWLADAWRRLGRSRDALELVRGMVTGDSHSACTRLECDLLNLEGMLRYDTGDLSGAETCWSILHARATEAKDHEYVARANNGLGVIFTLQRRPLEAVTAYERAVAAYRVVGWQRGIAQTHLNLAITYRDLEHFGDALEHFECAIRYAQRDGSEDEIARAEQERALSIYLASGDVAEARAGVRGALLRFARLGDPVGFADGLRVLAMIALGEHELDDATAHAEHALDHARSAGNRLLEGEALEVLGGVAAALDNAAAVEAARMQASLVFDELQAPLWGAGFREHIEELVQRARLNKGRAEIPTGGSRPPQCEIQE